MKRTPRTAEEVAALDATYRPFEPAAAWSDRPCDTDRWRHYAATLQEAVRGADPGFWAELRERFMRAAALDSSALSELVRPAPDVTAVVLRESVTDEAWREHAESTDLVVECHRRALVVAADAAADSRPIDEHLIAVLQDMIVESQQTYTVTVEDGRKVEVELPRRHYKPVSNYLRRPSYELVPFAPAGQVAGEMARFAAELRTEEFGALHPVLRSTYLHATLTHIHPFSDGNGRLARTLAAIPLLGAVGLPPLLLVDQWPAYARALEAQDAGDARPMIELFLSAHINSMDLAAQLLRGGPATAPAVLPRATGAEHTLLDLATVQLRDLLAAQPAGYRVAVTGAGPDPADLAGVRVSVADDEGHAHVDVELRASVDGSGGGWAQLRTSGGEVFEAAMDDLLPVPVEIVQLRMRSWLEGLLRDRVTARTPGGERARVRGLFVLGSPRSGTTLMGNYLGSHPDVLGLAEYGAFYVADSVAPAYLTRLPGREHEGFTAGVQELAAEHAAAAARADGCTWYCDATPWNLEVAARIAGSHPDAVFVLMLRHFSGAVLSLRKFDWAGGTAESAARLWARMNACIDQLPTDRTLVVGYDALAADPVTTLDGIHEVLATLGLDPAQLDATQLAASHAALIGHDARPTVAELVDGEVRLRAIPSLDAARWTPKIHDAVWPVVGELHRALQDTFGATYVAPPRPEHVPPDQW